MHKKTSSSVPGPDANAVPRQYLRVGRLLLIFLVVFLVSVIIQSGVIWVMYSDARSALSDTHAAKLSSAALAASAALSMPFETALRTQQMNSILWRIRESHQLDVVAIVDRDCRVLASARGLAPQRRLSVFDIAPGIVAQVFDSAGPQAESVSILGDPYERLYYPVMHGDRVWGVFCLAAHNPLPKELLALQGALAAALGTGFVIALILGLAALVVGRFADRARYELIRTERLAATGTLAASIAHEVKNPLGVILSSVQLLGQSRSLSPDENEMVDDIEHEVRRASDQIETFLDIARDMPLKLKEEDIGQLVQETIELFAAKSRQAGIPIQARLPADPVAIAVDRRKLRRALVNLVLNSLEALSSSANGQILVTVQAPGNDKSVVEISVEDNGPGIPAGKRDLVLQPFHTTKQSGTGLGLTVARQIAEQHGGSLAILDVPGRGVRVVIRLTTNQQEMDECEYSS